MAAHNAEIDARPDCRCSMPKPTGRGTCETCGRFACEYADRGQTRCSPAICDCFIDMHPDSPRDLHPEDFLVNGHRYDMNGHMADCPGCVTQPEAITDADDDEWDRNPLTDGRGM